MRPTSDAELLATIGGREGLAEMLRRVRSDRGLSQAELGGRVGRPYSWVQGIESPRGQRDVNIHTVTLLARACEVSIGLFVASFCRPREDPLPWPREHRSLNSPTDPIPGPMALGATLRHLRLQRNWTQHVLAERAGGASYTRISDLERGSVVRPLLLTLTRLGRAFGDTPVAQISYTTQLAQSYAGEIEAPPLRRIYADYGKPPIEPG